MNKSKVTLVVSLSIIVFMIGLYSAVLLGMNVTNRSYTQTLHALNPEALMKLHTLFYGSLALCLASIVAIVFVLRQRGRHE